MQVFFSVGEPSGDLHASALVRELQRQHPGIECAGFGGPLMAEAGCQIDFQLTDLAVMGLLEIPPMIGKFWRVYQQAANLFDQRRPDVVVLVDFPGFNWWVAQAAKRRGIPVVYYLPPQMWAWAPWRIHKLRRLVDHVLCCLPFEYDWYHQRGVSSEFVGHPFFDETSQRKLDPGFLAACKQQAEAGQRLVAVLPGSRNREVHNNFPLQCEVMRRVLQQVPNARFLVASFKESQRAWCANHLRENNIDLPVELHLGRTPEIIEAAETCLMVSGSVSLEVLARCTPSVVLYNINPVSWLLSFLLLRCPHISLPNMMAGRLVMPEFGPRGKRPTDTAAMSNILSEWLNSPLAHRTRVGEMAELCVKFAQPGATSRAANAILSQVEVSEVALRRAA